MLQGCPADHAFNIFLCQEWRWRFGLPSYPNFFDNFAWLTKHVYCVAIPSDSLRQFFIKLLNVQLSLPLTGWWVHPKTVNSQLKIRLSPITLFVVVNKKHDAYLSTQFLARSLHHKSQPEQPFPLNRLVSWNVITVLGHWFVSSIESSHDIWTRHKWNKVLFWHWFCTIASAGFFKSCL